MKNQEPIKPTGNLEELFRHHLAEAAVPPRPYVWEQVDNTLLVAQNETYRRRLVATRWVAAASLLLATLAGTGWWTQRDLLPASVATKSPVTGQGAQDSAPTGKNAADQPSQLLVSQSSGARRLDDVSTLGRASRNAAPATGPVGAAPIARITDGKLAMANATEFNSPISGSSARRATRTLLAQGGAFRSARQSQSFSNRQNITAKHTETPSTHRQSIVSNTQTLYAAAPTEAGLTVNTPTSQNQNKTLAQKALISPPDNTSDARDITGLAVTSPTGPADTELTTATLTPATLVTMADGRRAGTAPLGSVLVSMASLSSEPLPMPLALPPAVPAEPAAQAHRWRFGLGYTAGLFQSNVDFSRTGTAPAYDYNPALGANSPALSEAAATEYRAKQRPGLSHRLRLQAIYRLGGRWNLTTGVEVAQQESQSATSHIFTGEQVPDLGQSLKGGLEQKTTARYRLAGLPLEIRYANPIKSGFSLYGRVGTVVSALLTTRTNVAQEPEATRTYTVFSGSTPYRRIMGAVRGAVGIQFRPAGHNYTLSLGPVAEASLWSLNRHPAQSFLSQSRPYSFGLEAGVEFGRTTKLSKL